MYNHHQSGANWPSGQLCLVFFYNCPFFFFILKIVLRKKKKKGKGRHCFSRRFGNYFYTILLILCLCLLYELWIYITLYYYTIPPFSPCISLSHFWNKHNTKYRPLSSSPLLPLTATISVVFLFLSLSLFPFWSNLAWWGQTHVQPPRGLSYIYYTQTVIT